MRLIGTINHQTQGLIFSNFLKKQQISHQLEVKPDQDWGSLNYGLSESHIWIQDEDQVEKAKKWLDLFLEHPTDPIFSTSQSILTPPPIVGSGSSSEPPLQEKQMINPIPWAKQPMGAVTRILILVCSLLMVLSELLIPKISPHLKTKQFAIFISPVDKVLIYDYPYEYELIDRYIQLYGEQRTQDLPAEANVLLKKINETPFWQGIYSLLLAKTDQLNQFDWSTMPLFEKISQGQVWRLFTPALLHSDIFHLFFNMLWLIVLGKQIEQRLSPWSYVFFLLILGIFSNTMQYLASGPNFIGFSGILCGMLTFIWERAKSAPWEGYELNRLTYLFMMVFIFGMASVQLLSFFMEKSFNMGFSPNIANIAHLSGALIGYMIGKTNIFSWRHS